MKYVLIAFLAVAVERACVKEGAAVV